MVLEVLLDKAGLVAACLTNTVGSFGFLAGGVGPDGWALDDGSGIYGEHASVYGNGESVHAARSGAASFFANLVVLRAVAGAFEPLG